MEIRLAHAGEILTVTDLFNRCLDRKNDAIYSEEFFCQYGAKYAVLRQQVLLARESNKILGAVRFYPKKREPIINVYVFMVDVDARGQGLSRLMLAELRKQNPLMCLCPTQSAFNSYFPKNGWKLLGVKDTLNQWRLD